MDVKRRLELTSQHLIYLAGATHEDAAVRIAALERVQLDASNLISGIKDETAAKVKATLDPEADPAQE